MMPSKYPPGSALYQLRRTPLQVMALKVSLSNRHQVAAWTGGHSWSSGVVIPDSDGGEVFADAGSYVVLTSSGWFDVVSEQDFQDRWVLVVDKELK